MHTFSFLVGALLAWFIARQTYKQDADRTHDSFLRDIAAPTDDEIKKKLEECDVAMRQRGLTGFESRYQLSKDPVGSWYLHYHRI